MKNDSVLVGPLLQKFFVEFLCTQKKASPQTICSYRDTFCLLLNFLNDNRGIEPACLRLNDLSATVILDFLDFLEDVRKNSARSRNLRLAAIRSFFRVVALRDPTSISQVTSVLAIPIKRFDKKLICALSRDEIEALLTSPDTSIRDGRRDQALLLTLYNTGARASEIIALEQSQVSFGKCTFINLHGKGRKERTIPLWTKTASTLRHWFEETGKINPTLAFPNSSGKQLTRNGLDYILQRAVRRAGTSCSSLTIKSVTPHTLRHTTATHLLQSGVDISVIALWLGHESIETTHIYVESDIQTKERALQMLSPLGTEVPRFKAKDDILSFLLSL